MIYLNQITLTGGIPFSITLPQAPEAINADLMNTEEIHAQLEEVYFAGWNAIRKSYVGIPVKNLGFTAYAAEYFDKLQKRHQI